MKSRDRRLRKDTGEVKGLKIEEREDRRLRKETFEVKAQETEQRHG